VLLLGATNYPWGLDQAIRRRFEKRIYIPLPDLEARKSMFMIQTRKQEACTMTAADFEEYASRTEGFSGSDIKIVVREALMVRRKTLPPF
jgi:vacuolar protein-sorting-associated protein 4